MTEQFLRVYDRAKGLFLDYLKGLIGKKSVLKVERKVLLSRYNTVFDEYFTEPFTLQKLLVEDGSVVACLLDKDGDYEESFVRDLGIDDVVRIILSVEHKGR